MLTSSDAKWRCMWHMLVWSILLTLVSQFLAMTDHIAFYILAGLSVLVLPVLTALYSNSAGQRGAGLLRFGYVIFDPVLVCLTVTPVQLLNRLPRNLHIYHCFENYPVWNNTRDCLQNKSTEEDIAVLEERMPDDRIGLLNEKKEQFLTIQMSVFVPIMLSLMMGRKTRKMKVDTFLLVFTYWLVDAIEAADLLETALLSKRYEHVIFTTEAILSIVLIVSNSYAVVTLCSYLSPTGPLEHKQNHKKFDFLYKAFVGLVGVFFAELPLLIARFQIILTDLQKFMHGTFYMWIIKDFLFVGMIIFLIVNQKIGSKYTKLIREPCQVPFDNLNVSFHPEKRDLYIHRRKKHGTCKLTNKPMTDRGPAEKLSTISEISQNHQSKKLTSSIEEPLASADTQSTVREISEAKTDPDLESKLKKEPTKMDSPEKEKKKVTFKIDRGRGKFLVLQAREDRDIEDV